MKIYASNNLFGFFITSVLVLFPALLIASEYTVKQGDTLWDISEEKMNDPLLWKNLWKANPHIKNPHLIFPGQKLNIPLDTVEMKKEEIQEQVGTTPKKAEKEIIPVKISPKKITPQKKHYLAARQVILQGGYISDEAKTIGKIVDNPQKKTLMGSGDYVYIETVTPANINDKFYIISKPERVTHPLTGEEIGYIIKVNGVVKVTGEDNGDKKALILESYKEIAKDDLLIAFYDVETPVAPDRERRPAIRGTILKPADKHVIIGIGSIAYLDKGKNNGIQIGDVFSIISGEGMGIPIGNAQVIRIMNKTSVAIVRNAFFEIKQGDLFRN